LRLARNRCRGAGERFSKRIDRIGLGLGKRREQGERLGPLMIRLVRAVVRGARTLKCWIDQVAFRQPAIRHHSHKKAEAIAVCAGVMRAFQDEAGSDLGQSGGCLLRCVNAECSFAAGRRVLVLERAFDHLLDAVQTPQLIRPSSLERRDDLEPRRVRCSPSQKRIGGGSCGFRCAEAPTPITA
jgi:hypothetical protein